MSRVAMLARRPDNRDRLRPVRVRSRSGQGRRQRLHLRRRRLSLFVWRTRQFRRSGRCARSLFPSRSVGGDRVRDDGRQISIWLFPDPHPGERASFRLDPASRADRDNEQRPQGTWAARVSRATEGTKSTKGTKNLETSLLTSFCALCAFCAFCGYFFLAGTVKTSFSFLRTTSKVYVAGFGSVLNTETGLPLID